MRTRCLMALLLPTLLAASAARAQHLDTRLQWQPQTEHDRRLEQPVRMEIPARAVVTGLPLLSEKTGVKLEVAPEDRETLGERKFTLIAQGTDLKSIMVQFCEALQECHWDVDVRGEQPVYFLHRVPGEEAAARRREEERLEQDQAERREAREARAREARAALRMTPEQLAELEKTDPMLARAVRDPLTRGTMQAMLSLPPEQVQMWRQEGAQFVYDQAPRAVRQAAGAVIAWYAQYLETHPEFAADTWLRRFGTPEATKAAMAELKHWQDRGSRITVRFSDEGCDFGFGVRLLVDFPIGESGFYFSDVALPARYVSRDEGSFAYDRMVKATGATAEEATSIINQNERQGFRHLEERTEANRKTARVIPTDPGLLAVVKAERDPADPEGTNSPDATAVLRSLATQTGLTIVSDYFSDYRVNVTEAMRKGMPLWEFLYTLGEDFNGKPRYLWKKAGPFLVLHDGEDWPALAQHEVPESLLLAYREKLKAEGSFTLDDLAGFAVALVERGMDDCNLPGDLGALHTAAHAKLGLQVYASLSPDQLAKARSEAGLPQAEMTLYQRSLIRSMARRLEAMGGRARSQSAVTPDEIKGASFRITEKTTQRKAGSKTYAFTTVEFKVPFGDRPYREALVLRRLEKQ